MSEAPDGRKKRPKWNSKSRLRSWAEAAALAKAGAPVYEALHAMCEIIDDYHEGDGFSSSFRMKLSYFVWASSDDPKQVRAIIAQAERWLEEGRRRWREGYVPDPFGEPRIRVRREPPAELPAFTVERRKVIELLKGCQHAEAMPYRGHVDTLVNLDRRRPLEPFHQNAQLVLEELCFLYRDQLPFGVGRDDPPINPWTGKPSCQPALEINYRDGHLERGLRKTWSGELVKDY
ncbi:hypothetical protein [Sphingobium cloacae]|uniref:Uncharacterized protein n=1 Tax=Sphingobium cloacae TaxID=120107 RepID=A0A1E1F2K5_9SPHN|nr:hypothetical protein [Sphingobium cloacae]BAV64757.1 hypothetical protein SCLO_1017170 [Sphingobium cloacae]